jgi:hypothetical protein
MFDIVFTTARRKGFFLTYNLREGLPRGLRPILIAQSTRLDEAVRYSQVLSVLDLLKNQKIRNRLYRIRSHQGILLPFSYNIALCSLYLYYARTPLLLHLTLGPRTLLRPPGQAV